MSYILNTESEQKEMLKTIGVKSMDDLFETIPTSCRMKRELGIPAAMCEQDLTVELGRLASASVSPQQAVCFLGGGSYDHFIPSVVDAVAGRGEFYTAYTPYQAEASQGSLQAFFEFQTMICQLTGMDVANASLYEGGSAVAEAAVMAMSHTERMGKILIAESVHPQYRAALTTYFAHLQPKVVTLPTHDGILKADTVKAALDETVSCVIVQSPNFFGHLEEVEALCKLTHEKGALFVQSFDPIGMGIMKRPGDVGVDIVIGEGQSLGTPMQYGGPYLGLLACRDTFVRKMPGRLVGQTIDKKGNRCWALTLQTREQHIRRERATSNICSNQGLIALRATVYLSAIGPQGLRETANLCMHKAHYAASELCKIPGVKLKFSAPYFREFTLELPKSADNVLSGMLKKGFLAGLDLGRWYPTMKNCVTLAVTEKRTKDEIDAMVAAYRSLLA